MIYALKKAYPEFPSDVDGEAAIDFRRMLVNTCQDKFEDMLTKIGDGPPEHLVEKFSEGDLQQWLAKTKRSAMATMKFIGHLYVRQLLAAAVIRRVVGELLDGPIPELQVEYALELLAAVGRHFDSTERDKAQLSIILDRLNLFKNLKGVDGKPCVSKRVQFTIQDLVELRMNGWVKKGFKEEAKCLTEVKEEQDRDEAKMAAQAGPGGGKGGGKNYGGGRRH
jgi:translation initiation factor 4G